MNEDKTKAKNIPYQLIIVFLLLALGIGLAGYFYYENQKTLIIRDKKNELSAIADLKVSQISNWRNERTDDARRIFNNRLMSRNLQEVFKGPKSAGIGKDFMAWLEALHGNERYTRALLFDAAGDLQMAVSNKGDKIEPHQQALVNRALAAKEIIFTDFHRGETLGEIHLGLTIPVLRTEGESIRAIGVLMLEIDPHEFLYPLIQSWPTPSETSETLLVGRDGNEVLYLNELRHRKDTALSLRFPVSRGTLPAAMAVQGKEGTVEGEDYRGIPVFAALRAVPGSPWFLVAKVDKEEIYAPIHKRAWSVSLMVFVSIMAAGLSVVLWWRQQRVIFYRQQYKAEMRFNAEHMRADKELRRYTTELKRSNEELQQFAYIASHDLQEPLRMISSYLQMIERRYKDRLDKDAEEFIGYAVDGANRLQRMINGLLLYSRVENQGKPFEQADSGVALEHALDNLRISIAESGAVITHDTLPVIMSDESQLTQILQNLIENAIKFRGEEPSMIHISAKRAEDEWVFSVRDNGIGIEPQYKERIFAIFQRLHGREDYPGIGIGLTICRRIVERHGGRIWIESEPGKGSTFYFTIPVREGNK